MRNNDLVPADFKSPKRLHRSDTEVIQAFREGNLYHCRKQVNFQEWKDFPMHGRAKDVWMTERFSVEKEKHRLRVGGENSHQST